jgi:predicted O-methyltransferase YrrM
VDSRVEAVLAEYEKRAADENARQAAGEKIPIDELLITIGRPVATFLTVLIKETKARSILELGTSYGNSTVWLAEAARATDGHVVSLDIAGYKQEYARGMLERAGLSEFVELRTCDAVGELERMDGPFDFILVDLWKDLYVPCLERFYPKLSAGALVAADNMIYPPEAQEHAQRYRQAVRAKAGIESMLLPIGHGIELSRFTLGLNSPLA